jgi:hypothetical protein
VSNESEQGAKTHRACHTLVACRQALPYTTTFPALPHYIPQRYTNDQPEGNQFKDRFIALQKKALVEPRMPQLYVPFYSFQLSSYSAITLNFLGWLYTQNTWDNTNTQTQTTCTQDERIRETRIQEFRRLNPLPFFMLFYVFVSYTGIRFPSHARAICLCICIPIPFLMQVFILALILDGSLMQANAFQYV